MKLLFSIDSLQAGGAEKSTLDIIYHLAEHWDITVVYYYAKHDLKEAFEKAPCQLLYVPLHSGYKFRKGIAALAKIIRDNEIDVIVTSLYRSGIISRMAGKRTGVPVIDTIVNDSYSSAKRQEFRHINGIKFFTVKALDKISAQIPKLWISNSAAIAASMGKALSIPANKITVIYRGRDTSAMKPWQPLDKTDGFRFVAAGRLVQQKGFVDLIHAFAIVYKRLPDAKLTIYGEGIGRQQLNELINGLGLEQVIALPGRMPDVWQQFYRAHCFVLPSHYEGLSGVLIEAQITGIPIVASNIAMNLEAAVSSTAISFFDKGNIADLAEKMTAIVEDYSELSTNRAMVREKAIERYELRNIAAQYHVAVRSVL